MDGDFFYAGTHEVHPPCDVCAVNMNELVSPLLYYWDEEFGTPQLSMDLGHDCFWGELRLMATDNGRAVLENLGLPFEFSATKPVKTRLVRRELIIEYMPPPENELHWARPTVLADADPEESKNELCIKCGMFITQVRQLTRLRIPKSDATSRGLFSVRQNRGGPIFVTEDTKAMLCKSGLAGIGFYPAGRIVD